MTKEDKEILLKDLCARLPYGVIVQEPDFYEAPLTISTLSNVYYDGLEVKPYLRPISSMTDKEREQYRKFSYYGAAGYRNNNHKEMVATPSFEKMDFLNAHHFDYRGLINKGLALEAPEVMYKHFGDMDVIITSVEYKDKL